METVKTWQKVTIAILALALVSVIAAAAVHARDAKMMNSYAPNDAGITETTESAEYHEPVVIDETTKAPAVQQHVPSAQEVAKELQKQFEKKYGNRTSTKNEYYNPYFHVTGSSVQIVPFHIWYQGDKMYVDSFVINMEPRSVTNISVNDYELSNSNGLFAQESFGVLNGNVTLNLVNIRRISLFSQKELSKKLILLEA